MTKKNIKLLSIAAVSLMGAAIAASTLVTVSCSTPNEEVAPSKVVELNATFADQKAKLQNALGLPKVGSDGKIDTSGEKLLKNAQEAVTALEKYKKDNSSNLEINETIWLDSYIYNWKTEANNWKNGLQYLGGNPSGDALPLNPNSNHLDSNIFSSVNIYEIDPDTLEPTEKIDTNLAENYLDAANNINDYIKALKQMLDAGMKNGVMQNNITKKLFVNQMMANYYPNELLQLAKDGNSTGAKITLPMAAKIGFTPSNSLLNNFDAWSDWAKGKKIDDQKINNTKEAFTEAQATLDDFMNWYINKYFVASGSYGVVNSAPKELKIYNENPTSSKEVERTINVNKDGTVTPIYGLGVTNEELNLQNVGIGFMNSKLTIDNKTITGNDMYQALLQFNNSVNDTPSQLVKIGIDYVKKTTENMKEVAKQVALINNPTTNVDQLNWSPKYKYDENISDNVAPKEVSPNIYTSGKLDFANFNQWLNQENFFFGRETTYWTTNQNLEKFTNSNGDYKNYLDTLAKLGYAGTNGAWTGTNSNKKVYGDGSVTCQQALAGAVLSLVDYNNFKNSLNELFSYSFNEIPAYAIAPYNIKIQEIIGVGLEGPRGSNIFNYNVNPYFSLPKWSQSSFQNHEGAMGHHTQQAYWTKYMPDQKNGPGYVFTNTAFHEGWAVFAEWYANQLNTYGSQLNENEMPTDWLNANGFVPKLSNQEKPTTEDINAIKNFQAGAYWEAASGAASTSGGLSADEAQAIAATKIANMLQYYGYLNEAQLRNMRLAVDPAYHHKATGSEATGETSLPYGASIKEVRDYLKANSGLGQGDIQSESYRYLNMPSQATGYMTGKVVFEKCFKAVKNKYETTNKNNKFLENKDEVCKLFDLILRNGEIPLDVVINAVKTVYGIENI